MVKFYLPQQDASTKLTKLEFRNRFTLQEKAAIDLASLDNPQASMEQRLIAASLRAMLADQAIAEFIDIGDESTITGVQYLAQVGLLSEERAQEVLTYNPEETMAALNAVRGGGG